MTKIEKIGINKYLNSLRNSPKVIGESLITYNKIDDMIIGKM